MAEPTWLQAARRYLGLAETPGRDTTPTIRRWLISLRAWWTDDEAPWCGVFAAAVMREAGLEVPRTWYRARAWLDWGAAIPDPVPGCVVVFERGAAGHVGFVVGRTPAGALLVLGGNQGDRVSIAAFDIARVLGYRWPTTQWVNGIVRPAEEELLLAALPEQRVAAPTSSPAREA